MTELNINIGCGCLNCEKLIPNRFSIRGKTICSKKCLYELLKAAKEHGVVGKDFSYTMADVWKQ